MHLARFPRRTYTDGRTPLHPLPRFSAALGGPEIWIKRDDLTGLPPAWIGIGDLDLFLVGPNQDAVLRASTSTNDTESVSHLATESGTYYLAVTTDSYAAIRYNITHGG